MGKKKEPQYRVTADFHDAGTTQRFVKDETVSMNPAEAANYVFAGLLEAVAADADDTPETR